MGYVYRPTAGKGAPAQRVRSLTWRRRTSSAEWGEWRKVSGWLGLVLLIGLLTVAILLVVALAVRHGQDRAAEAARWRERSEQDQWNWDLLRGV